MHCSSHSPYLKDTIREVVSDCALPISVVIFSFIGSYLFLHIKREYRFHLKDLSHQKEPTAEHFGTCNCNIEKLLLYKSERREKDNIAISFIVFSSFCLSNKLFLMCRRLMVCNILILSVVPVFSVHDGPIFNYPLFDKLSGMSAPSAVGLGFLLSLLIFIDQNIVISLTRVLEHR